MLNLGFRHAHDAPQPPPRVLAPIILMDTANTSPFRSQPVAALDRMDSWKLIAAYLGREVRTVQRWERKEALPVHRHLHSKGSSVYAFKHEIDAWLLNRRSAARVLVRGDQREFRVQSFPPALSIARRPVRLQVRSAASSRRPRFPANDGSANPDSVELCIGAHRIRLSICVEP